MSENTEIQTLTWQRDNLLVALTDFIHNVRTVGMPLHPTTNEQLIIAMKAVEDAGGENKI